MDPLFLLLHYLLKAGKEVSFPSGRLKRGTEDTAFLFQGALQSLEQVPHMCSEGRSTLPSPEKQHLDGDQV